MTPEQLVKRHLLIEADLHATNGKRIEITDENIDDMWEDAKGEDGYGMQDHLSEFRESGSGTGLPTPYSRNYECNAVGRKLNDGTWVGWDYWYGGGKHSEPEAIDWMGGAYLLDVTEEEKLVTVRTFSKKEAHENT